MRILLAAVGRARKGPARDLFDDYVRRINWPLALREVEERRPLAVAARKRREAELLLAGVPDGACLVALDASGRALTSAAFAQMLAAWEEDGRRDVAFLIGGPDGLDPSVLERAELVLSLGPMTWPHLLVRVLLAEQLYRAQSILAGHPYHRA